MPGPIMQVPVARTRSINSYCSNRRTSLVKRIFGGGLLLAGEDHDKPPNVFANRLVAQVAEA
jgi:hypothetical protein